MSAKPSNPNLMKSIERLTLAHRYLYYVKNQPILSDRAYDLLEKEALLAVSHDSPLQKPGSDKEDDYPPQIRNLAQVLLDHEAQKSPSR